jgi:hypothetical protein
MTTWQLFFAAALMLLGISLVARPIISFRPVDMGRLFFFATLSYVFISQGVGLMQQLEQWRSEAGSYIYTSMSGSGTVTIPVPGQSATQGETLYAPQDLDGPPLRGWEAVATSYFLVRNVRELHQSVPPPDLRLAYCLYDPNLPVNDQAEENQEGCSPRKAWDEWDEITFTLPITNIWGIPLPGGIEIDYPLFQEHPENRQLGLRQAQSGVARLALGPIVALFPIVEANVGLMLALAASFIYLSMPLALLFSFFLYTESMVTRLIMQWISIFLRTLILNGLVAIFLLILMGAASSGSLTVYLGLVGVGVVGGFFLVQMAASIMKESLSMSLGAVGAIWKGTATATLGKGAERPAEMALGAAKLAATGATMAAAVGAGGAWASVDMADPALSTARSGLADIRGQAAGQEVKRPYGQIPDSIRRLTGWSDGRTWSLPGQANGSRPAEAGGWAEAGTWAATAALALGGWDVDETRQEKVPAPEPGSLDEQAVEQWARDFYDAGERGTGQKQMAEMGRGLLGEKLAQQAQEAMARRSQAQTMAALKAASEAAKVQGRDSLIDPEGRLKQDAVASVRGRMGQSAAGFKGKEGEKDLAVLTATALNPQKTAPAAEFQRAAAEAKPGQGAEAPGRTVPQALGLDPAAAGEHFSTLNRFARTSEQAGLTPELREKLLQETRQGEVSKGTRREIEVALRHSQQQGKAPGLQVEAVIAGAEAMPATLKGPQAVKLAGEKEGDGHRPAGRGDVQAALRQPADRSERSPEKTEKREPAPTPGGRVRPEPVTAPSNGGPAGGITFDDPFAPTRREKRGDPVSPDRTQPAEKENRPVKEEEKGAAR